MQLSSKPASAKFYETLFQGWYIVTYAVGIFILNQFIAFLTPKMDPALQDCEGFQVFYVCLNLLKSMLGLTYRYLKYNLLIGSWD